MAQTTTSYYLERRYAALESEIADALRQSPTDDLAIADLKYRKLIIADEIQHNRRLVERFSKLRSIGRSPRQRFHSSIAHRKAALRFVVHPAGENPC